METIFEGRPSDSPYVEMIWRGRSGSHYAPVCPADVRWNLLFSKYQGEVKVTIEGPLTKATPKTHPPGVEWLVIRFKLGVFIPTLPVTHLLDGDALLPGATHQSFWLHSSTWQLPTYDNAETFIDQLVRDELLVYDHVVSATLQHQMPDYSFRTIRRRFLHVTGLTPKTIEQIERANQAVALLSQGQPILEVTYQLGYADQPHLTRSLKRFIGQTPAQLARV